MLWTVARKIYQNAFTDGAAALLFPLNCRVCGEALISSIEIIACQKCWTDAIAVQQSYDACEKCDARLPKISRQPLQRPCGKCDKFAFQAARTCGSYAKALRESVQQLKTAPYLSTELSNLLGATFQRLPNAHQITCLMPVPLHPNRLQSRSYNQAEVIAQKLSQLTKLSINNFSLIRVADTERHRAGMDEKARAASIHNAFAVRAKHAIAQENILVVDDVMTTGATAHEIAETLLKAGANSVSLLTLARAVTVFGN